MKPNHESHIDFAPADISEVSESDGEITVVLPSQPCYSESTDKDGRPDPDGLIVPLYACAIRVARGNIELMDASLPYSADSVYVEFKSGAQGSFLPKDFAEEGPVSVQFLDPTDKPVIVIRGENVSLEASRTGQVLELAPDAT